jgi:hypothetical protein
VGRLVDLGLLVPDGDGTFSEGDARRARLYRGLDRAGLPTEAMIAAHERGELSFAFLDLPVYDRFASLWGKETGSRAVSGVVVSIWCRLFPDQVLDVWPKAPSGTDGRGVSALKIDARWSRDGRTIRRLSRGRLEHELRHMGKPSSGMHAAVGAHRCSSVRRGRHGSVRRSRLDPRSLPRAPTGGPPGCPPRTEHRGRGCHTPAVSGTEVRVDLEGRGPVAPVKVVRALPDAHR